jgi:hypothetical protein
LRGIVGERACGAQLILENSVFCLLQVIESDGDFWLLYLADLDGKKIIYLKGNLGRAWFYATALSFD